MIRLFDRAPAGLLPALFALVVYVLTGSRSIGYWDAAELATSGAVLGIAHPTGYPLFTMMSRLFGILLTGLSVFHNLNLMVALWTALAVFLFHRLFLLLLTDARTRTLFRFSGAVEPPPPAVAGRRENLAAGAAALTLAFSRVFWSEGVMLEVYSLHLVFFAGATLLFLRALAEPGNGRWWLLFAYVLGLSFSHHMMMVLLAPAFLFLYFAVSGFGRAAWLRIARAVPVFLLGLTPYLYLPVRAASAPLANWGDPSSLSSFWAHVSAAQYRFKMFSSWSIASERFLVFARELPGEFAWVALPFAALGVWALVRRSPRLAVFTGLLFAAGVLQVVAYDFDDPNFRLHCHVVIALWAAFGAHALLPAHFRPRLAAALAVSVCALLALVPLAANYRVLDRSADRSVEDYSRAVLASVERGALILSGDLEGFVAGSRYLQVVEGVRPDVAVVGLKTLLFPWYYGELEAAHPRVARAIAREVAAYVPERRRIDRGAPPDARYEVAFNNVVRSLLRASVASRPTYVAFVPYEFVNPYRMVPQGMLLRISLDPDLPALPPPVLPARPLVREVPYVGMVASGYAWAFLNHSMYHRGWGNDAEADRLLRAALQVDPANATARGLMEQGR